MVGLSFHKHLGWGKQRPSAMFHFVADLRLLELRRGSLCRNQTVTRPSGSSIYGVDFRLGVPILPVATDIGAGCGPFFLSRC